MRSVHTQFTLHGTRDDGSIETAFVLFGWESKWVLVLDLHCGVIVYRYLVHRIHVVEDAAAAAGTVA